MSSNITVPELGESVVEATVARWLKKEGDRVSVGEPLVELETEKVDLEVGATEAGVLARIDAAEGSDVQIGAVLGVIEPASPGAADESTPAEDESTPAEQEAPAGQPREAEAEPAARAPAAERPGASPTPADATPADATPADAAPADSTKDADADSKASASPARTGERKREKAEARGREAGGRVRATASARKLAQKRGVDLSALDGTGDSGRVTRKDVERALKRERRAEAQPAAASQPASPARGASDAGTAREPVAGRSGEAAERSELEERVRLSRRRQTIARRLVEAQRTAAMLTTFNEVDMTQLVAIRRRHKEPFRERHGVNLGISSFFVKAVVSALRAFPRINAEIQGDEMVLKRYYDIGIAVGAREGLVVPVVRDADRLSFAEIEGAIKTFVQKAEDGELTFDDLKGGTFTITNGGVFGSLLSTPILNPPQVGILGMHKIEDRAVPLDGQVVIRPMMYLALSYDHRIVDGLEAVQFLVHVKDLIEDPAAMLFG